MQRPKEKIGIGSHLQLIFVGVDWVVLNIALGLSFLVIGIGPDNQEVRIWVLGNIAFIVPSIRYGKIHGQRTMPPDRYVIKSLNCILMWVTILLALLFVYGDTDDTLRTISAPVLSFTVMLPVSWLVEYKIIKHFRNAGYNFREVIIIGSGKNAQQLMTELQADQGSGYRIIGIFDNQVKSIRHTAEVEILRLDHLEDYMRNRHIDTIFYTLDGNDKEIFNKILLLSEEQRIEFIFVPRLRKELGRHFLPSRIGEMAILTHNFTPLSRIQNQILKRTLDLTVSSLFLAASPLIFIPIAIGIKLTSPGPVFFRQKRTGIFGEDFMCYKFRTMRVNSDSDTMQATKEDPRKTKFGNFLRKTSLDELPQFINVFIGNMSVVGPRPHMVSQTESYSALISDYMVRHAIKPGITGWAQVNGYRGGTEQLWQMEKRVQHDVWYISNWNIFLDIRIMIKTITNALKGEKNAY